MATGKKSFVLYCDLINNIDHLTNEEKGILFTHLLDYVNDKNPVLTDRLILTAWKPIERQLKRDLQKFEEVKIKRSEAGKRSAKLKALNKAQQSSTNSTSVKSVQQSSTNSTVNDNVNDNENENVNDISLDSVPNLDFTPNDFKEDETLKSWRDWLEYNYHQQRPINRVRQPLVKADLKKLSIIDGRPHEPTMRAIIKKCIAMDWKNLQLTDDMKAKLIQWQAK